MNATIIPRLTSPGGGSPLRLATVGEQRGEEIVEGTVLSPEQGMFRIHRGVLDLLPLGIGSLSLAQSTNLFEPVARFYERPWRVNALTLLSGRYLPAKREKQILFDLLGKPEGALWLDLAASTGLYGRWLAPGLKGRGNVVGIDLSRQMLRRARAAAAAERVGNIGFVAARAEQLPFADGTVDGVLCGGSLNEFGAQGMHQALGDLYRVLKPGAVGIFMHLLRAERPSAQLLQALAARPGGLEFPTREETDALFALHGFAVEERFDLGVVGFTRLTK